MALNVGLDPHKDIRWVTEPARKSIELFAEGKIDAFIAFFAGTTGAAREKARKGARQYDVRAAVVTVFLLHGRK